MSIAVALAGWLAAAAALAATVIARRALARRHSAIAEACHELRSPLTALTLGLELSGRQGSLSPARIRAIELELGQAALALDDLQAARHRREHHGGSGIVDVGGLLSDTLEAWRPLARLRGIDVRLHWSGPEALVRGDRLRLAQAIGNLIANAIEHGEGNVHVSGRVRPHDVRIEILDLGPGLTASIGELIRRSRPGRRHGHGLRIAQEIAGAHGGRLASAPSERGARLVLELPIAAAAGPEQTRSS